MLWADYYGGDFREWPKDLKGYNFGVYVHAGIFTNHVIQDPLVYQIPLAIKEAVNRHMNSNIFVNGQDFKHFILNLEVCARAAWDTEGFNSEQFYTDWTSRYFGTEASPIIINSLKLLNEAHKPIGGFESIMDASVKTLHNIKKGEIKTVKEMKDISTVTGIANMSLNLAQNAINLVPKEEQMVYDDQIVFPATIYCKNIKLLETITLYCDFLKSASTNQKTYDFYSGNMKNALLDLRKTLDEGSKWKKWDGWTKCENFRVMVPPPSVALLDEVILENRK